MYQIIAIKMIPEKYDEIKKFIKKQGFNISFWAAQAIIEKYEKELEQEGK